MPALITGPLHLGNVPASSTLYIPFATYAQSTGESITMSGLATSDIKIYKDGSTTERASASGFTLLDTDGIDFDGVTGLHGFSIDLSDNTTAGFYAAGHFYWVVVSTITVDGQTVSFIAATFGIRAPETTAGVPKTEAVAVSTDAITSDSFADGAITGPAIADGAIDSATFASGAINAAAIASDAITAAKIADGAIDAATFAAGAINAAAIAADAITAAKIADGAIDAATFAAGAINAAAIASSAITAAKFAADAIDANALKADAANEIADALLDRAAGVETGRTLRQALRLILAVCCGKSNGLNTSTAIYRDTNDGVDRITATVDNQGNRSAVTYDMS
jgi:hypothetical protein